MKHSLVLACLILAGCDHAAQPETKPVMPVEDTVFAPAVSALDKAKGVQDTLQKNQEQNDAALRANEQ